MDLIIQALKIIGLFAGSVVVAMNIEILFLIIMAALRLGKFYEKNDHPTITEFIVFFMVIAGIILSFQLVGVAYDYFGIGGRVWALLLYMFLDMKDSVLNILGMGKSRFGTKYIIYEDEIYPVFAARLIGFIAAFILLIFKVV